MKANFNSLQFFLKKTAVTLPLIFIIHLSSLAQVVQTERFGQPTPAPLIPSCNLPPALSGWSVWLGGVSDDWNVAANWCDSIPTSAKDAIILDSVTAVNVYGFAPVDFSEPSFYPVIKNGVIASTRKLRIHGADSLTINANLANGSLNVYDSLNIVNSSAKLKVISSKNDTAQLSNGNLLNVNAYPFNGNFARQRMWVTYTVAELMAQGMQLNDVIDSMIFYVTQRNSTVPYINFEIKFFYATANACFLSPASGNPVPPITGGAASVVGGYPGGVTTVFSGTVDLTSLPASGGAIKIPLTTPFVWNNNAYNFFVEICYDNAAGGAGFFSDQTRSTQTLGCQSFYKIQVQAGGAFPPFPGGCSLLPNSGVITSSVTTGASGGSITWTFAAQASPPFAVGGTVNVSGATIALYNGAFTVTGCTTTSVDLTYGGAGTGAATDAKITAPGLTRFRSDNRPNITYRFHRNYVKYPVNIQKHWSNNGIFEAGNSIASFIGTSAQNIDGTSTTTFHELSINNSNNVRQNTAVIVEDTLFLQLGKFLLNGKTLTLNNGLTGAITRTNNGYLRSEDFPPNYGLVSWKIGANTGIYLFPFINTSGEYVPFRYTAVSGTSDFTIGTYHTPTSNLPAPNGLPGACSINYPNINTGLDNSQNMVDRFWIMSNSGTNPVGDFEFNFGTSEQNGGSPSFYSQGWSSSACWQFPTTGQTSVVNQNTTPGVSVFHPVWALIFNNILRPNAVITPSGPTTFCNGGNVMLNATTGTGFSYQWFRDGIAIGGATSSSYTASVTGNYTVQITYSAWAVVSDPVTVTVNALPNASITAGGPVTFCGGGSVTLNAVVAANRTYQWKKNGINISGATSSSYVVNASGTYKVTVTNTITGCTKTTATGIVVTKNPNPAATISPSGTITFCAGQSALLTANSGAGYTYKWKKDGSYIGGATSLTYTVTTAGKYRVEVTNSFGCSKTSSADTVVVPCKVSESENEGEMVKEFDMTIFPNPSQGVFTIHFSEKPSTAITIEMMDAIGQVIDRVTVNEKELVIDKSNLAKGIYYLSATSKEAVLVKKIVIQ